MVAYISSRPPLPLIPFREDSPGFNVTGLTEHERAVLQHLALPHVRQAGSHTSRGCGFNEGHWEDRYHCTMIEPGEHLWKCMVYIELNMVRAGVVRHPEQWPWCSYQEWMGQRERYVSRQQTSMSGRLGKTCMVVCEMGP